MTLLLLCCMHSQPHKHKHDAMSSMEWHDHGVINNIIVDTEEVRAYHKEFSKVGNKILIVI